MDWKGAESARELRSMLESGDVEGGRALVGEYLRRMKEYAEVGDALVAEEVLLSLRDYTLFDLLHEVGSCIKEYAPDDPRATTLYCLALIESGEVTQAIDELTALRGSLERSIAELNNAAELSESVRRNRAERELDEVLGLLGRAYKQLYVSAKPNRAEPRTYDLERSVRFYSEAFHRRPAENYWHGGNFIALRTLHERIVSGDSRKKNEEAKRAAAIVVRSLDTEALSRRAGAWQLATRAEAHLALGENEKAIETVRAYLDHEELDRFKLSGTIRQFREIWRLTEDEPPGLQILPMMTARLATLPGVRVDVDVRVDYEVVWGDTGYQPIEWLANGLLRARSVARLGRTIFDGAGTGFRFDGSWLGKGLDGKPLLLTNAHVCTSDGEVRTRLSRLGYDVLPPEEAVVAFLGAARPDAAAVPIRVKEEIFTSPPEELDATLLLLESAPERAGVLPLSAGSVAAGDRVNIIGHPHGKRLSVSLQDNKVVGVAEDYLHYKTPTDPGSSGSPIFSQSWELVGLHHASKRGKQANEGIPIRRILDAVRRRLS